MRGDVGGADRRVYGGSNNCGEMAEMKTKAGVIAAVKSKTVMTYTQEVARVAIVKGAMAMQADAMATIAYA